MMKPTIANVNPSFTPSFAFLFALLKYHKLARLVKITVVTIVITQYIVEIFWGESKLILAIIVNITPITNVIKYKANEIKIPLFKFIIY